MKTSFLHFFAFVTLLALVSCSGQQSNEMSLLNDSIKVDSVDSCPKRIGVKMQKVGGVYEIPCIVNGVKMNFIFDTGASNVCVSLAEALFMYKNGYITDDDLGEKGYSTVADGSIVPNMQLNLKSIEIGGIVLSDVEAIVVPSLSAPLLLGQSAIQKIGKIEIDGDSLFIEGVPSVEVKVDESEARPISLLPAPKVSWWDKVKAFMGDESKSDEMLEAALNAYNNDMRELAWDYCNQAKKLSKRNWKPYAYWGNAEFEQAEKGVPGYYVFAVNEYEEAIKLNKKKESYCFSTGDSISYAECRNQLARAYALAIAGNCNSFYRDNGFDYIQRLVVEEPNNAVAVNSLVIVYKVEGQLDVAEKWARKLLQIDPEKGYFQLGHIAYINGDYEKAIHYYEKSLDVNPASSSAMNNLANALIKRDNKVRVYPDICYDFRGTGGRLWYEARYESVDYNRAVALKKKAAKLGSIQSQNWLSEKGIRW